MTPLIDETGNRYGRLVVLRRAGSRKHGQATWRCICDCGEETSAGGTDLRGGHTKSCGCLHREQLSEARRLPKGEAAFNALVHSMKYNAKERGYAWELTRDQVRHLTSQPCHYCGVEPERAARPAHGIGNGNYLCNGIDRVDNKEGYTVENTVPCCKTCNFAKRGMAAGKFLAWVERVHLHQKEKQC